MNYAPRRPNRPTLDTMLDHPRLTVEVEGVVYRFSELPLEAMARIQAWIRTNVPHPLDALKGRLDGLDPEDRRYLLDRAYDAAQEWPPRVGTKAAGEVLAQSMAARLVVFLEGLRVHQPNATEADAQRLHDALIRGSDRADGIRTAKRILQVLHGVEDDEPDDDDQAGDQADGGPAPKD